MNLNEFFNGANALVYVFLIATIVLTVPIIARINLEGNLLPGEEPYYHEKAAKDIIENGLNLEEDLKNGLYHPFLAGTGYFMGMRPASMLMPLLFGISSLVIFYLMLRRLGVEPKRRMLATAIAAISPPFIYAFATSNPYSVTIFLTLLGLYLVILRKRMATMASILLFMLVIPSGLFPSIVIILTLILYYLHVRKKTNTPLAIAVLVGIMAFLYNTIFPQDITLNPGMRLLVDFGSAYGFGIFTLILAAMGFYVLWRKKGELFLLYTLVIFLIAASVFLSYANFYLNFVIAIYAAVGFMLLAETRWDLESIKKLTIILIACGLIFSTASYSARLVSSEPTEEMALSLEWLKLKPDGNVLSHQKNGFWIEAISEKHAVINEFTSSKELLNDTNTIFRLRNVENARVLMDKYDIRYIWIDKRMRKSIWKRDDEGLLFLFTDIKTFKNIYRGNEVEIWEYMR